jgi:outer membrane protein assembly factor BamE (lipoprotein component of BamABCDE complex)
MRSLFALAFAILLSGCATVGKDFDAQKADQIVEGQTTKSEVIALLGKPSMTGTSTGGLSVEGDYSTYAVYSFAKSQARPETFIPFVGMLVGGVDSESKSLTVFYNEHDVVTATSSNQSSQGANTGLLN